MRHPLILMAAGVSSRMKKALDPSIESAIEIDPKLIEEANTLPKCMLSVWPGGTRFIDYILWNAHRAGFEEVVVLLNPSDTVTANHVTRTIGALWIPLRAHFAIQHLEEGREKPWWTGDAVRQALEQSGLGPGDIYSVSNSDNLCGVEVFRKAHQAVENTSFPYDTESLGIHPDDRVKYGLVLSNPETGAMTWIVEKPSLDEIVILEKTSLLSVNMNIMTLSFNDTFGPLWKLLPHPIRNEKEVTDVLMQLAKDGRLRADIIHENLPDLTSKADIPRVQKYLEENYPEVQKLINR